MRGVASSRRRKWNLGCFLLNLSVTVFCCFICFYIFTDYHVLLLAYYCKCSLWLRTTIVSQWFLLLLLKGQYWLGALLWLLSWKSNAEVRLTESPVLSITVQIEVQASKLNPATSEKKPQNRSVFHEITYEMQVGSLYQNHLFTHYHYS